MKLNDEVFFDKTYLLDINLSFTFLKSYYSKQIRNQTALLDIYSVFINIKDFQCMKYFGAERTFPNVANKLIVPNRSILANSQQLVL